MRVLSVIVACAALLPACAPKVVPDRIQPRKVYKKADPLELFQQLQQRNEQISSVLTSDAEIEYRFTFGDKGYRGASLRLAVEKPGKVYARGSASVAGDLFILASNGQRFWAEVPREEEIYTGSVKNRPRPEWSSPDRSEEEVSLWLGFQPSVLAEALLIDDLSGYAEHAIVTHPDFYIIELFDRTESGKLALRRKIWFEREGLTVRRHRVYSPEGDIMTEVFVYNYVETDGLSLPRLFRIERYWEELSLRLTLNSLELNRDLDDSLFTYEDRPPGYEVIDLDIQEQKESTK